MKVGLLCAMLLASLALQGCAGYKVVPPGHVGVLFDAKTGSKKQFLKDGSFWTWPHQRLVVFPNVQKHAGFLLAENEGDRAGDDTIKATTIEGAELPLDVVVAWHVEATSEAVDRAFDHFGETELDKIQDDFIRPTVTLAVNSISGQISIFDLMTTKRETIGPKIREIITPQLEEWGITVDDVNVQETYPAEEIRLKSEERTQSRTNLDQARTNLQKAKLEAKTTLTNAHREAEQIRSLASQGKDAFELKELELLEQAIDKWNGQAPLVGKPRIPFTDIDPSVIK